MYNYQFHGRQNTPTWVTHTGPPFANGKSHLGHFYNMVNKDAINRYKLMQKHRVHMMPGFDCYGLGIEDQALGKESEAPQLPTTLKQTPKKLKDEVLMHEESILSQRKKCRQFVKDSIISQMNDLSKWGILTDFRYSYFTMMPAYEANVLERFADLMDKRMVSRGNRPVFWSVKQQRIMSEDDFTPAVE